MSAIFTQEQIEFLRQKMASILSGYRLHHTMGVEAMAVRLGQLYCPEKISLLQAAALLHDLTKELPREKQLQIFASHGMIATKEELASPATLHAVTASLAISEKFPEFADEGLLSAVRYHTTGRADMSLAEKLIYLADYIEEGRSFDACVCLRREFFDAEPEKMIAEERMAHLNRVLLHSFDLTVADLCANGKCISLDTVKARNSILYELENKNERK